MDTSLTNGDFTLASNGRPEQIDGVRELLQRAAIRLNVPLGGFVYDTQFGSLLHSLGTGGDSMNERALAMAQDALKPLPQFTVESAICSTDEPKTVKVALRYSGGAAEIEVNL